MKRSLSLIVLAAICALALAAVTSLSGCAVTLPMTEPDKPVAQPEDDTPAVTGETASYTSGYVDMALTIPEGWQWESVQDKSMNTEGIRFWKTDDRALDFKLLCWRSGYGICGTGVTSEELTLSNGQMVWQHTEAERDGLWLDLYFENVPGDYVCQPAAGAIDKAAWDGCRDEVLSILGTAQFGRDAMTQQAAIAAAQHYHDVQDAMADARYDVNSGSWTVTFRMGDTGQSVASVTLGPDGIATAIDEGGAASVSES